jgi:hypothetical protein
VRSRRSVPVALGVTCALALAGVATAATVTPPAGTPDLSQVVIQPTDLAPGAVVGPAGYQSPISGFPAIYANEYRNASTPDGVTYYDVDDSAFLGSSPTDASLFLNAEKAYFKSQKGQKQLKKIIIKAGGKAHLKAKDISFGGGASAGVGTASAIFTERVATKRYKDNESIVLFTEGDFYSAVALTATANERIPLADAVGLATATDTHIKALIAAGSTGASGTTGTTGTTTG